MYACLKDTEDTFVSTERLFRFISVFHLRHGPTSTLTFCVSDLYLESHL